MPEHQADRSIPAQVAGCLKSLGGFATTAPGIATLIGLFVACVFLGTLWFGGTNARTFTAEVFGAVAWPLALLVVVLLFFRPLCDLASRARSPEAGSVAADLRERFRRLEEQTAPLVEEAAGDPRAFRLDAMLLELEAARSSKQAILDAWAVVERSLRDLVWLKGHTQPPRTFKGLATRIREEKLLSDAVCAAVETLRGIFVTARSTGESDVSPPDADEYQRRVSVVVAAVNAEIQKARTSHGDG